MCETLYSGLLGDCSRLYHSNVEYDTMSMRKYLLRFGIVFLILVSFGCKPDSVTAHLAIRNLDPIRLEDIVLRSTKAVWQPELQYDGGIRFLKIAAQHEKSYC